MAYKAYTKEELSVKIDEFISLVESGGIDIPDDYSLSSFLGVSTVTLDKYFNDGLQEDRDKGDNNTYKGYSLILKKIRDYREHWYSVQAIKNPKLTGHCAFALKQAKNGGWTDKQETVQSGDIKLQISLTGADGKPYKSG